MLLLADGVGETQVNVLDLVVFHHLQNFGCGHYSSSNQVALEKHTAVTATAVMI
jgi:hypothetical protein